MSCGANYSSTLAVDLLIEHSQTGAYCEQCEQRRPCDIALVAARAVTLDELSGTTA